MQHILIVTVWSIFTVCNVKIIYICNNYTKEIETDNKFISNVEIISYKVSKASSIWFCEEFKEKTW